MWGAATVARKTKRHAPRHAPGYDGRFELGVREVDDPFEPGKKLEVPANMRHDPIQRAHKNKQIDDAQLAAGNKFRQLLERAGAAGAPVPDMAREPVDGGAAWPEPDVKALEAAKELAQAHRVLGVADYRLVHGVVVDGLNATLIAQQSFSGTDDDRKYVSRRLRAALDALALLWGYREPEKAEGAVAKRLRASRGERPGWGYDERVVEILRAEPVRKRRRGE